MNHLQSLGDLVRNTNLLRQLLALVCNNAQMHQRKVEKDLADTEFSVTMLGTKLGEQMESAGTDSMYSLIEDLVRTWLSYSKWYAN